MATCDEMASPLFFKNWGIDFAAYHDDAAPCGSPARADFRRVLSDAGKKRYVVAAFSPMRQARRIRQSILLENLAANHLEVVPVMRTCRGDFGVERDGFFWQLRPWIDGAAATRKNGEYDSSAVMAWCDFLWRFHAVGKTVKQFDFPARKFYFSDYFPALLQWIKEKSPHVLSQVENFTGSLEEYLNLERFLPRAPAHGDFHPQNILMRDGKIAAVIDWEFAGEKPAGYDAALLLGCLIADSPARFKGEAVAYIRNALRDAGILPKIMRRYFPDLVIAIRLAWFGEWLDSGDAALAENELHYIRELIRNRDVLVME